MKEAVAVINGGSSSIKFSLFTCNGQNDLKLLCKGQVEGIGTAPRFEAKDAAGELIDEKQWENNSESGHDQLMDFIIAWAGKNYRDIEVIGVGHRVVHGGKLYSQPVVVDDAVLGALEQFIPLAPLHQPHNLDPIRDIASRNPDIVQVACFDTAFHTTNKPIAQMFALPRSLTEEGVRRYGFHGLSYEYISKRMREIAPAVAKGRMIVAHLGSGASMCAMLDGKSIASTLGFSALDGLPMGTRTGVLDPGVVLYLLKEKGMSASELETLFYKKSGLLGVSGISNDMRVLLLSEDVAADEAVDLFVYRINREIGSLTAALGGLDALVFTAGIGERSPEIRQRVCEAACWTGLRLDESANQSQALLISEKNSPVSVWVVPTNEELMIATHTLKLIKQGENHA